VVLLNKERSSSLEVVDNNEDVVHPQKRHIPSVGSDVWLCR
jgi:hypothetical protein